ncbi:MAG: allophanate hydrolase [Acidiphilium sp.]|nr:allophanate hydrolase [Acidiphilium sp.]MDD4936940.1 allophanate hydrolase [Acidiphilium sp.]
MIPDPLEIAVLRRMIGEGQLTVPDLVAMLYDRALAYPDPAVFITLRERADLLAEAALIDPTLPLAGMVFAVKDNIDVAGLPTTAACPAFSYMPMQDATVVARLRAAGAIPLGKTNLDQFATGLNGTRSPYGAPRSVFGSEYISGGSSSGSAVAAGTGICVFALGTDTAGSGRIPAGFNNVIGLKPTRGRVPASGVVPACQSLDCVSIFANSAADAATILSIAEGHDPDDPYSRAPADIALPSLPRIGILAPDERVFADDAAYAALHESALAQATALGWTLVEIDYAPFRAAAALLYEDAFVAERLAGIRPFFRFHADAMDPVVAAIIEGAERFDAADAFLAATRLQALRQRTDTILARIDALLLPTSPTIFTVAELRAQPVVRNATLGRYTNFVNLLDLAAVALPAGFRPDGLPFGMTLIGPAFTDRALLYLADALHHALGAGAGASRAQPATSLSRPVDERISLVVAGAHLSGMMLNHELTERGAILEDATTTAPAYRLFTLATTPPKPGLVRDETSTTAIAVERWSLTPAAFAGFVASLPAPMTIGKVELADGSIHPGFCCEPGVLPSAIDITTYGGWRAYRASITAPFVQEAIT